MSLLVALLAVSVLFVGHTLTDGLTEIRKSIDRLTESLEAFDRRRVAE